MSQESSTARTVFVRFIPPSANIRRHHLEDLFSQIGPIKKSSVIVPNKTEGGEDEEKSTAASSYGFVKYAAEEDARKAAEKLNRSELRISPEERIRLRVERASDVAHSKQKGGDDKDKQHSVQDAASSHKKTNRLILRNLSFYAKESHIRQALQKFGPIEDVHLPTVSDKKNDNAKKTKTFHRGFGFVTFVNAKDAQNCLQAKEIEIYKRKVQIDKALHKAGYEKRQHDNATADSKTDSSRSDRKVPSLQKEDSSDDDDSTASSDSSASESSNDDKEAGNLDKDDNSDNEGSQSSSSEAESESDSEMGDSDEEHDEGDDKDQKETKDDGAVGEKRSLFLRNLPFDATRHDIFEAFRKYGRVSSIYIVKDKQSGLPRGTAFLSFETQGAAHRAMQAAGSDNFSSQRDVSEGKGSNAEKTDNPLSEGDGIMLRGRRVFVNIAVDKDTASTLTLDKQADRGKMTGKDRRNLYLKGEGRVDNDGENKLFDQLPEQDKLKRQKAWSEKNTKLKSPLFLISPTRLSIRNLSKDVDERGIKKLCVSALQRGLQKKLVTAEDQIAQWRAAGDMTTREIIQKVDALDHKDDIIPEFDDTNIRKYIPSVFIERDFSSNSKDGAPSRGFCFVEFLHHTHALACLRELNNNTSYSEEFVSGGRHAMAQKGKRHKKKKRKAEEDDSEVKIPRLIVDFAVENRAKAKKQADYKAHQRANAIKQKIENKEKTDSAEKKKEKKKSRGARQRERKRKAKEEGASIERNVEEKSPKKARTSNESTFQDAHPPKQSPKSLKPTKKKKVNKAEENLSKLVDEYEKSLIPTKADEPVSKQKKRDRPEKRWFED